jgi:hypothetical protein
MAWDHKLALSVLDVFSRSLLAFYKKRGAAKGVSDGQCGGVTVIQRAGGSQHAAG